MFSSDSAHGKVPCPHSIMQFFSAACIDSFTVQKFEVSSCFIFTFPLGMVGSRSSTASHETVSNIHLASSPSDRFIVTSFIIESTQLDMCFL